MSDTMVQPPANGQTAEQAFRFRVSSGYGPTLDLAVARARLGDAFESIVRDELRLAPPRSQAAQLIDSLLAARDQGALRVERDGRFHHGTAPAADVLGLRGGSVQEPGTGAKPGVVRLMREWSGGAV